MTNYYNWQQLMQQVAQQNAAKQTPFLPTNQQGPPVPTSLFDKSQYSRFGNAMARGGGFGPMLNNSALQQQITTPDQLEMYNQARKAARNKGLGQMMYALSDAFGGRDIGKGVQERQKAAAPIAHKTYKGADGYTYWLTGPYANQRVNPNIERTVSSSSDPLRTISKDGVDIGAIRDSELTEEKIDELYGKGFVIQPLGRTSEAKGRPSEFGGWSDEGGLQTKYLATNALVRTGDRLLQNLYDNPTTVLTVGDFAQWFERAQQEVGALSGRPLDYNKHLNDSQLSKITDLAEGSAATESMLLDFTFQIAAARGQEGRGLSDKDFIIFQKIISAGQTANQKAAALTTFIEGIQEDVTGALDDKYKITEIVLARDPSNKESLFFKQGIEDLRKAGMLSVTNPFSRTKNTGNTKDPLGIRP